MSKDDQKSVAVISGSIKYGRIWHFLQTITRLDFFSLSFYIQFPIVSSLKTSFSAIIIPLILDNSQTVLDKISVTTSKTTLLDNNIRIGILDKFLTLSKSTILDYLIYKDHFGTVLNNLQIFILNNIGLLSSISMVISVKTTRTIKSMGFMTSVQLNLVFIQK